MGLKNDRWIKEMAEKHGMIEPFVPELVKKVEGQGIVSYGLSSYGYDIRVADEFKIFTNAYSTIVDPKNFDPHSFVDFKGKECIIPPNSFCLARSVEYFKIPRTTLGVCLGKSTYARCGIIVNITPLEPCYDDKTEILTDEGWKYFKDLHGGEQVLTLGPDMKAVYKPIERRQVYEYEGNMIHFKNREIDLMVTPEHKVFVQRRTNAASRPNGMTPWYTIEAAAIYGKWNHRMSREVNWEGELPQDAPEFLIDEWFLRFLGVYLGDGSSYMSKGRYVIKLAVVSNERKWRYYKHLMNALKSRFNIAPHKHERGFMFHSKMLYTYVHKLGHAAEKYIPREVLNLPPQHLAYVWEGLMQSDGTQKTRAYTTTSKQLADNVQELLFKLGYSAIVRPKHSVINGKTVNAYIIRQTEHRIHKVDPQHMRRVPYKGLIYDVTAKDNHIVFVRRNGYPVWSGNCWEGHLTIEISNTTPLPAKIYANEGIAQLLFLEADEECEVSYADRKGKYQNQKGIVLPKT